MADNVHRKLSHKPSEASRKTVNPVHRTTTETMRLGEPERTHPALGLSVPSNIITPNNNQCRKKTSSFQITSVTVGSRMSNDAGEDSNDDLDESHGEDNSVELSRITDIETPSYSEDTFSKEDVFFNTSNAALSTAPVIPTSSQYGLAIVPSEGGNVNNSISNDSNINAIDITAVTDNNIINLLSSNVKQDTDIREVHSHGRNERFKVVKIESTEPFKRGRWTCMDYLDHTSVNQSNTIGAPKMSDPNEVCISYGVTDGGIVALDALKQVDDKALNLDMNGHATHQDIHGSVTVASNQTTGYVNNSMPPQSMPVQTQVQQNQIPQYFQNSPQQQPQQQQQASAQQQGTTLPANLQNTHPNNLGQSQSMPQGSIPIITQTNNTNVSSQQQNISHSNEDAYVTVNSQSQSMSGQNVCQSSVQQQQQQQQQSSTSASTNLLVTQQQSPPQQQQPQQQQTMTQISEPMNTMQAMQPMQNIHKVPQNVGGQQQQASTIHPVQPQVGPPSQLNPPQAPAAGNGQVQMGQVSSNNCQNIIGGIQPGFHGDAEQEAITGLASGGPSQLADAALLECLAEVTQSNDDHHTLEDNESMSGTSAVAIDNKIEQAMDLVKSHLMFAVREEVEVLKEKIAELMDRINQLEGENSVLRAHATSETLALLSQATSKLPSNNSASGGQ